MGQEIVYCFKCQKRIMGADYAKGLAYQLENASCCAGCAVGVLETLPPKAKEQLLAKMFKSTHERERHQTSASANPQGTVPSSTRKIPVAIPAPASAAPQGSSAGLWAGGAAVVVVVVLIVFATSGGNSPKDDVPRTTSAPVKPPRPAVDPGPSADDRRRDERAKEALRAARDFEQTHPKDLDEQLRRWKAVKTETERTGYEAEAEREIRKAESRIQETAAAEIAEAERQVRAAAGRKEYRAALDLVEKSRPRRGPVDWTSTLDRLDREVRALAASAFEEVKTKAKSARDRGAKSDLDALKADVRGWGIPEYLTELETALATAWTPIFDGKSTACLSGPAIPYWRIEEGGLCQVPGQTLPSSGQTREPFGDGEFRFKVLIQGVEQFYFALRQAEASAARIAFATPDIQKFGEGEHELIVTCRGGEISATMDGTPVPVAINGKLPAKGRIMFNYGGGKYRLLALDYRPLPP